MKKIDFAKNYAMFITFNTWLERTHSTLLKTELELTKACKDKYKLQHKGKYSAKSYTTFLNKQNIAEYRIYGKLIGYVLL